MKRSEPVPVAAIHSQAITPLAPSFPDEGSALDHEKLIFLHTFIIPSLQYSLMLVSIVLKTFLQNSTISLTYTTVQKFGVTQTISCFP